jgi:hypothetical protein
VDFGSRPEESAWGNGTDEVVEAIDSGFQAIAISYDAIAINCLEAHLPAISLRLEIGCSGLETRIHRLQPSREWVSDNHMIDWMIGSNL